MARSPGFPGGGNGLLLGPIFTSSSHGYDTVDYFQIDPRLGDDADFDALVAACRDRGVRLLLDGVFNHVGRDFPPVAQALAEGPGSAAEDWVSQLYDTGGDHRGLLRGPRQPDHPQSQLDTGAAVCA